ncbi:MAG TPA: ribosome-associated protein [Nitrospiraceae bacterium]|nr:ribosome-associated protein [Nitrospiraceae bacterium]
MEQVSRTQKKKAALSLLALGKQLVTLSSEQLRSIDLPVDLLDAVTVAKSLKKHGARHRQMQYIGTLMRRHDPAPIQDALRRIEQGTRAQTEDHRKREKWRDELIAGNDLLIEEILIQLPHTDRQQLTDLVQRARQERAAKNPVPKAARILFRYLTRSTVQR